MVRHAEKENTNEAGRRGIGRKMMNAAQTERYFIQIPIFYIRAVMSERRDINFYKTQSIILHLKSLIYCASIRFCGHIVPRHSCLILALRDPYMPGLGVLLTHRCLSPHTHTDTHIHHSAMPTAETAALAYRSFCAISPLVWNCFIPRWWFSGVAASPSAHLLYLPPFRPSVAHQLNNTFSIVTDW